MSGSLELLLALADEFGATATIVDANTVELDIALRRIDRRGATYRINVSSFGHQLCAKEAEPRHLPSFCPERHINFDGSFCLYWKGDEPIEVTDPESARTWMETLYKFLIAQERARKKRQWPSSKVWAHGDAAQFQLEAMRAAAKLGALFVDKLDHSGLAAVAKMSGHCANHPSAALELAEALSGWQQAETQFWKSMQGYPCCGTCDACPLVQGAG